MNESDWDAATENRYAEHLHAHGYYQQDDDEVADESDLDEEDPDGDEAFPDPA